MLLSLCKATREAQDKSQFLPVFAFFHILYIQMYIVIFKAKALPLFCFQECLQCHFHLLTWLYFFLSIPPLFCLYLAGAWDYCANQDISSGWVNISFFICAMSIWLCERMCDHGKTLISKMGIDLNCYTSRHRSTCLLLYLTMLTCFLKYSLFVLNFLFNLWSFLLPSPLFE